MIKKALMLSYYLLEPQTRLLCYLPYVTDRIEQGIQF